MYIVIIKNEICENHLNLSEVIHDDFFFFDTGDLPVFCIESSVITAKTLSHFSNKYVIA